MGARITAKERLSFLYSEKGVALFMFTQRQNTALAIKEFMNECGTDIQSLGDLHNLLYQAEKANEVETDLDTRDFWLGISRFCRDMSMQKNIETHESVYHNFYDKFLLWETKYSFLSFILYMEKNRPYTKRFFEPRRKTLCITVQDFQDLEDRKIEFLGVSQPSRTGKSTLNLLFLCWIACKRPTSHNAMGGHSGGLTEGFYKECLSFMTSEEYTFQEIYERMNPGKRMIVDKNAEKTYIVLCEESRFATLTFRGIEGAWTGAIDVSADGYLVVDDLVKDREHSLSPTRLQNTYQSYLNNMVDRKIEGARELMVGTLWNVLDPLNQERVKNEGRPGYRFRRIPALDPITDESNFHYEFGGFSTKYFRQMREKLDPAEWMAKYQQNPFVREGLLFPSENLRYFNGILPDGDSRVVAVVDVAFGGGDSLSMPIGREYPNGDVYIFDWIFSSAPKEATIPLVVGAIIANGIRAIRFEANNGGDLYCGYVDDELKKRGYKCSCTYKRAPGQMEKISKINAYSGDIKRNFVFLVQRHYSSAEKKADKELGVVRYERTPDYTRAMEELCMFVVIGKNVHDDAADGLTQLAIFIENPNTSVTQITKGGRF